MQCNSSKVAAIQRECSQLLSTPQLCLESPSYREIPLSDILGWKGRNTQTHFYFGEVRMEWGRGGAIALPR